MTQEPTAGSSRKIAILGGGIIGLSTAYRLLLRSKTLSKSSDDPIAAAAAASDLEIVVFESSSKCAQGASGKAGGFLAKSWCDGEVMESMTRLSFDLHQEFADQVDSLRRRTSEGGKEEEEEEDSNTVSSSLPDIGYRRLTAVSANASRAKKLKDALKPTTPTGEKEFHWLDTCEGQQGEGLFDGEDVQVASKTEDENPKFSDASSAGARLQEAGYPLVDFESIGQESECAQVHTERLCEALQLLCMELCSSHEKDADDVQVGDDDTKFTSNRRHSIDFRCNSHLKAVTPDFSTGKFQVSWEEQDEPEEGRGGVVGAAGNPPSSCSATFDDVVYCLGAWLDDAFLTKKTTTTRNGLIPEACLGDLVWTSHAKSHQQLPEDNVGNAVGVGKKNRHLKVQSIVVQPPPSSSSSSSYPSSYSQAVFSSMSQHFGCDAEIYPRPDGTVYVCGFGTTSDPLPKNSEKVEAAGVGALSQLPVAQQALPPGANDTSSLHERLQTTAGIFCSALSHEMGAQILKKQACFLPAPPDGRTPVVGEIPVCDEWAAARQRSCRNPALTARGNSGLWMAAGHSCWGILNSHATGKVLAEMMIQSPEAQSSSPPLCCDVSRMNPKLFFVKPSPVTSPSAAPAGVGGAPQSKRKNEDW